MLNVHSANETSSQICRRVCVNKYALCKVYKISSAVPGNVADVDESWSAPVFQWKPSDSDLFHPRSHIRHDSWQSVIRDDVITCSQIARLKFVNVVILSDIYASANSSRHNFSGCPSGRPCVCVRCPITAILRDATSPY